MMLLLSIYAIYTFVNAAIFCGKLNRQQEDLLDELSYLAFFYFSVPAFSLFYHYILTNKDSKIRNLTVNSYYNLVKPFKVNRLLKENEEITIKNVQVKQINKLNYVTHEIEPYKIVHIKYRYNDDVLHNMVGFKYELVERDISELFINNANRELSMKESELQIMLLNNRLDSLQRIGN